MKAGAVLVYLLFRHKRFFFRQDQFATLAPIAFAAKETSSCSALGVGVRPRLFPKNFPKNEDS